MFNVISFLPMGLRLFFSLFVGPSSGVDPPKRKKGTKENETAQPAGTVYEMEQEFCGL